MSPLSQNLVNTQTGYRGGSPLSFSELRTEGISNSNGLPAYGNVGWFGSGSASGAGVAARPGHGNEPAYGGGYSYSGTPQNNQAPGYNSDPSYGIASSFHGGSANVVSSGYGGNSAPPAYPGSPGYNSSQNIPGHQTPPRSSSTTFTDLRPEYFTDPFGINRAVQSLEPGDQWQISSMRLNNDGKSLSSSTWGAQVSQRRADVYGAVQALTNNFSATETMRFFTFGNGGRGQTYQLNGSRRYQIPFQWYHNGPGAIPAELADASNLRSSPISVRWVLDRLNEVFGMKAGMGGSEESILTQILQEYINEGFDFGCIYGLLRPWWFSKDDIPTTRRRMNQRKVKDREMRRSAMDGDRIVDTKLPPRRIWDLYSNRVLPYYVLDVSDPKTIPGNVWAVSHSWLAPGGRAHGMTPINRCEWPVPIPVSVDLNDVRIELLNLGAEYVFLDVLCLRQKIDPTATQHPHLAQYIPNSVFQQAGANIDQNDYLRRREWRLDVPTIGRIYRHVLSQTTITYFNGLGLPFSTSPEATNSDTHWFKRVWTLQETTANWIAGGLTTWSFENSDQRAMTLPVFGDTLKSILEITMRPQTDIYVVIGIIRQRSFTNPVDRISGLAYLLRCSTIPIYEPEALDVEDAWNALVEHMDSKLRADLLIGWAEPGLGRYSWYPSWAQLMSYTYLSSWATCNYSENELLQYTLSGCLDGSPAYFNHACLIENGPAAVSYIRSRARSGIISFDGTKTSVDSYYPPFNGNSGTFCLVIFWNSGAWLIGSINGSRTLEENKALSIRKRGTIVFTHADPAFASEVSYAHSGSPNTLIMYT